MLNSSKTESSLENNINLLLLKNIFHIILGNVKSKNLNGFPENIPSEDNIINF